MTHMRRTTTVTLLVAWLGLCAAGVPASALGRHTPQHRYLTEQKNRTDIPAHYEPLTFAEFLALPAVPERYTPPDWETVRTQTQRGISLEGYIAEVIQANGRGDLRTATGTRGSACSLAGNPAAQVWRCGLTEPADRDGGDPTLPAPDDRLVL